MTARFHPNDSTLMSYAAGALSEAFAIIVGAHAETCDACRSRLRRMNALGGVLMASGPTAALDEGALERTLQRIADTESPSDGAIAGLRPQPVEPVDLPESLARLVGGGSNAIAWRTVLPGVEDCRFTFPARRAVHTLRFLHADPGQEIPEHSHAGLELTLVLRGALRDGRRIFRPGDVSDLDETGTHNPIADGKERCLCVVAEEGPPRFTSAKIRALQKRIGI